MTAEWRFYRENGQLWHIGHFEIDIKEGPWIRFQENEQLYDDDGKFSNGKKAGEWKNYDGIGNLIRIKKY